jgi:hypothetical protein
MNTKLRNALATVVRALENDTVEYNWRNQGQCNCGLVIQALTDKGRKDVQEMFSDGVEQADKYTNQEFDTTWKNLAKASCSVTGKPLTEVFQQLHDLGMNVEDMVHLEYLDNPAIYKESGIQLERPKVTTNFWGKQKVQRDRWYDNKNNLIKYLKAWIRIIDNDIDRTKFSKDQLAEVDILIAKALATPVE